MAPSTVPSRCGAALALAVLVTSACGHSEPFASEAAEPNGPPSTTIPRQLTYNPGDNRSPNVTGDAVAYSRYDPARGRTSRCIAILPVQGGTLRATFCPPDPTPADTFVSTWLEPALSPDGRSVAFLWQRGTPLAVLAAWSHHLTIAPADSPAVGRQILIAGWASGQRFYDFAVEPTWTADGAVRFLAAFEGIHKVKGGGADRFTDTVPEPRALMQLDPADGTMQVVAGGDSVIAYAPAGDGGTWIVKDSTPAILRHLDGTGSAVVVGTFPGNVSDLAEVDQRVVAAIGDTTLVWMDPATGETGSVVTPGPVWRVAAAGARLVILEMDLDMRAFGAPAQLWLYELPVRTSR